MLAAARARREKALQLSQAPVRPGKRAVQGADAASAAAEDGARVAVPLSVAANLLQRRRLRMLDRRANSSGGEMAATKDAEIPATREARDSALTAAVADAAAGTADAAAALRLRRTQQMTRVVALEPEPQPQLARDPERDPAREPEPRTRTRTGLDSRSKPEPELKPEALPEPEPKVLLVLGPEPEPELQPQHGGRQPVGLPPTPSVCRARPPLG